MMVKTKILKLAEKFEKKLAQFGKQAPPMDYREPVKPNLREAETILNAAPELKQAIERLEVHPGKDPRTQRSIGVVKVVFKPGKAGFLKKLQDTVNKLAKENKLPWDTYSFVY